MPSIVLGLGDGTINQTPSPTGVDMLVGATGHKLGEHIHILDRMTREGLLEEVTFEQTLDVD